MIYKVKKGEESYQVDDLVFFHKQPARFQAVINADRQGDTVEFDNATILLLDTGRVLVNLKPEDDEQI